MDRYSSLITFTINFEDVKRHIYFRVIMVLKMDELPKFLPALCVFILFNSIIAQPFMDALNPHHHFYVYPSGGVTKYYNSSEWPSDYEEDLNNLQLLRGTRILTLNRSSCVLRTPEDKELYEAKTTRKNSSSGGIRFAEIAKVTTI